MEQDHRDHCNRTKPIELRSVRKPRELGYTVRKPRGTWLHRKDTQQGNAVSTCACTRTASTQTKHMQACKHAHVEQICCCCCCCCCCCSVVALSACCVCLEVHPCCVPHLASAVCIESSSVLHPPKVSSYQTDSARRGITGSRTRTRAEALEALEAAEAAEALQIAEAAGRAQEQRQQTHYR